MQGLPHDGTATLIAQTLGQPAVAARLADTVYARTGGNPFFVQELVRALADQWSCPGSVESLGLGAEAAERDQHISFPRRRGAWMCGRPAAGQVRGSERRPPTYPHPLLLRRRLLLHAAIPFESCRSNAAGQRYPKAECRRWVL